MTGHDAVHASTATSSSGPTGSRSTSSRRCAPRGTAGPAPTYLDLPDDVILGRVDEDDVRDGGRRSRRRRAARPPTRDVDAALAALRTRRAPARDRRQGHGVVARRGRGARVHRARPSCRSCNSPMGKGVMPDDHPLSVGAARSHALQEADLILLLGARLNWIMHFGLPPRFNPDVRVIQLDISAEQLRTNVPDRGRPRRRRQGGHGPAQRGARRRAVAVRRPTRRGGSSIADEDRGQPRRPSRRWPPTTRCR